MDTESQVLARCLRGDAEAWDDLFAQHYGPTARFIFQVSSDFSREDVEEICQETFLTVIKSLHTFQRQSQFQTWLFRIAANKAHDFLEKQRAAKRGGGVRPLSLQAEDDRDGAVLELPAQAPGPDRVLIRAEDANLVSRALSELGGPCQEVIELRYFADLSYDEIGASLGLNVKTVSSRLSKCLDKLEVVAGQYFPSFRSSSQEKKKQISV